MLLHTNYHVLISIGLVQINYISWGFNSFLLHGALLLVCLLLSLTTDGSFDICCPSVIFHCLLVVFGNNINVVLCMNLMMESFLYADSLFFSRTFNCSSSPT